MAIASPNIGQFKANDPCHSWLHRLLTVAVALTINAVMFILMPTLLQHAGEESSLSEPLPVINVIRLPKPDTPVKKEEQKPPEPPPKPRPPEPVPPRPVLSKPKLPFTVNPRLPEGPPPLSLPINMADISFAGANNIFTAADLDSPLLATARLPPMYPHRARHRHIEGWVQVQFVVHEDGSVGEIAVLASEPAGIFEESVIAAVSGWRFRPGTITGVPVKTRAETTIHFELDK